MHTQEHLKNTLIPQVYLIAPIRTIAYDLEKYLLLHVESSNPQGITDTLHHLTEYVGQADRTNLPDIRSRLCEQCSVLIRICIENGISVSDMEALCRLSSSADQLFDAGSLHRLSRQLNSSFLQLCASLPQLRAGTVTVCKTKGYIARNYASRITLEEIAGYVHLNATYFSSVFKKHSGTSFLQYLNRYRIQRSRQLLKTTHFPIIDIAISSGFDDQSHFTKTFKKYAGVTPAYYRYSDETSDTDIIQTPSTP